MRLRTLGRLAVALFVFSTAFPVLAGVLNLADPPRWLGVTDVVFAAILFIATATVSARTRGAVTDRDRLAALRVTQIVIGLLPALLVIYFIAGSRINWTVMIIGLAWRAWLLVYSLPALVNAMSASEASQVPPNV